MKKRLNTIFMTLILLGTLLINISPNIKAVSEEIMVSQTHDLICGQTIWVNGSNLVENQRYYIYIENSLGGWDFIDSERADSQGDITTTIHIPYRNPLGTYDVAISESEIASDPKLDQTTLHINNTFWIRYKVGGVFIDHLIYNKSYQDSTVFTIYIYNWTGSKYDQLKKDVTITLKKPDGALLYTKKTKTGTWDLDLTFNYKDGTNLETNYLIDVVLDADTNQYSYVKLLIKLDVTATIPTTITWGDTITLSGYVRDGKGHGIKDYPVKLYSPTSSGYQEIDSAVTFSSGRYSLSAPTDEGSAGTWYIGTELSGTYRIDETNKLTIPNFISYQPLLIQSDNTASIKLVSPDVLIAGFTQTINISVKWNKNALSDAWIYVTGISAKYKGTNYSNDDLIAVGDGTADYVKSSLAYYEFDIMFLKSGTARILLTHPFNNDLYDEHNDLLSNVTGFFTLTVVSANKMSLIVENMPQSVKVTESGNCWRNTSTAIIVKLYGGDEGTTLNGDIQITGCGLNIELDEKDSIEQGYWISTGIYHIPISPKYAGALTIAATNTSKNLTIKKDYIITGLTGTISTSIADDQEITVQTTEDIIISITNGAYAEVHLSYYDEKWTQIRCLDQTIGDATAKNGLNGVFEFTVDKEDIEEGIGFIVVAAKSGGTLYLYDVIEVVPAHDLRIELLKPTTVSHILTVGMPQDIQIKVFNQQSTLITDIDQVKIEIINTDGDVLQTNLGKEKAGNIWFIDNFIPHFPGTIVFTAKNNSGENEHDGSLNLTADRAQITFSPTEVTAALDLRNIEIICTAVDTSGTTIPKGTRLYLNREQATDTTTSPAVNNYIILGENGEGVFTISKVGDMKGSINFTFQGPYDTNYQGNTTDGSVLISYPHFTVSATKIYIGKSNTITITATDSNNNPIQGINLTLLSSNKGTLATQPDPVTTDNDGIAILSVQPLASGTLNVTIARNIRYINGQLTWDNAVITDTVIQATWEKQLEIQVSKNPVFEAETFMVNIVSNGKPVPDASVKFAGVTKLTNTLGNASFTAPNPTVETVSYTIIAEKEGYGPASIHVTVIKQYSIAILGPSENPPAGSVFTITVLAKGQALAGATVTLEDQVLLSDENGKVSLRAPSKKGNYSIHATFEGMLGATYTLVITNDSIPGFELLLLIVACIVVVAIVLFYRKKGK
ncbi:MAG: Ig-like domain-containing protein [Candidatus Thermoplasmatota archaeon]|nr:Ig-like domain-containing protein [Candidatus Thermoplasmatota archaeon]